MYGNEFVMQTIERHGVCPTADCMYYYLFLPISCPPFSFYITHNHSDAIND